MVSTVSAIIILDHFDKFDSEEFLLQCEQTLLGLGSLSMEKAHALVAYFNCNIVFVLSLPPEMEDFADALFATQAVGEVTPDGAGLGKLLLLEELQDIVYVLIYLQFLPQMSNELPWVAL